MSDLTPSNSHCGMIQSDDNLAQNIHKVHVVEEGRRINEWIEVDMYTNHSNLQYQSSIVAKHTSLFLSFFMAANHIFWSVLKIVGSLITATTMQHTVDAIVRRGFKSQIHRQTINN